MEKDVLLSLVSLMLPENILSRFSIVNVEKSSDAILIYLEEKIDAKYASNDLFGSKGFLNPVTIRDFPLRDKAVDLVVRRRRWINRQTNESFTVPYDEFKAEGTRYSKEFAAFLKEVYGDETYELPFA
ncbi:hypothetical protein [uncultured Bacteroides sp.]|uniref:ISAon1 family transposase N-terminal region protein n=1 Tax=uncultured Bacteroides sp. TaxID=162156 RepID=UPI002AAB4F43|nr:hypothetical protein [uncultured Bacteroides sp.]